MSLRHRWPLIAILCVAFGLRCAYAFLYNAEPAHLPIWDGTWYDRVARDLLAGQGVRDARSGLPTAFFPPGYPALLALVYGVFGKSWVVARLLNCALATLTVALTYAIGSRAYGERAGLIAAGLLAVWPGDVFYASLTLSEVTFGAALTACIWLFGRWDERGVSTPTWLVFGILLGLAALIRGAALFWVAVPALLWWLQPQTRRASYARAALIVAGMAIAIAPWTIRNAVMLGHPVLIASDGPMALFIGHSPPADGSQSIDHWEMRIALAKEGLAPGRRPSEAEIAMSDQRYAIRYFFTHPGQELRLIPRRLHHLFRDDHHGLTLATEQVLDPQTMQLRTRLKRPAAYAGLARLADLWFFAMLTLATIALVTRAFRKEFQPGLVVPLTVLFFLGLHGILFWGDPRFHAPFVPMLAILAALTIDTAARPWRAKDAEE